MITTLMRHLMSSCCPGSCKSGEDRSTSFAPYIELILNAAETLTSDSPLFEVFRPSSSNIFPPEFSCCCLCISTFRLHSVFLLFLLFFFSPSHCLLLIYFLSFQQLSEQTDQRSRSYFALNGALDHRWQ